MVLFTQHACCRFIDRISNIETVKNKWQVVAVHRKKTTKNKNKKKTLEAFMWINIQILRRTNILMPSMSIISFVGIFRHGVI